jgi:peptide deformylase
MNEKEHVGVDAGSLRLDEIEKEDNSVPFDKPHDDLVIRQDKDAEVLRMRIKETTFPLSDATTKDLDRLEKDFEEMVKAKIAVGLSANQVSAAVRACCVKLAMRHLTMINPRIVGRSGKRARWESCLSIPFVAVLVRRAKECTVEYQDRDGNTCRERFRRGGFAMIVQHEVDHLNGKMIDDYINANHSNVTMYIPDWAKEQSIERSEEK